MRLPGPWAAGERVLVCVSEAPSTAGLIRYARRVAERLQAPWTAIYVETARTQRLSDAERDRIADFLRLAERLGASTITIPGRNIAEEVVAYATANNITQIVIGKSEPLALVRDGARLRRARARAQDGSDQRSCHLGRRERAGSAEIGPDPSRGRAVPNRALSRQRRRGRRRPRYRPVAQPVHRRPEHLARISDGGACLGDRLGPVAVAVRRRPERAGLQFFLPAAALHVYGRRSRERRRAVLLSDRGGHRQQFDGGGRAARW